MQVSKVVLITGGSSGIGKSVGELLVSKGFIVYGTSRNPEKYSKSSFPLLCLDVRIEGQIHDVIQEVVSKEGRIDVLVNNAGVGITGPVEETPKKEIINAFEVNFFGPIDVIKAILPQMRLQHSGLIINITSIAGYMGLPYRGVYSATKGALELITESLRAETKDFGIRITNLAPGDFLTNIASGRYHSPVIEGSPYEKSYQNTLNLINSHTMQTPQDQPPRTLSHIPLGLHLQKPRYHAPIPARLKTKPTRGHHTLKSSQPNGHT